MRRADGTFFELVLSCPRQQLPGRSHSLQCRFLLSISRRLRPCSTVVRATLELTNFVHTGPISRCIPRPVVLPLHRACERCRQQAKCIFRLAQRTDARGRSSTQHPGSGQKTRHPSLAGRHRRYVLHFASTKCQTSPTDETQLTAGAVYFRQACFSRFGPFVIGLGIRGGVHCEMNVTHDFERLLDRIATPG